MDQAENLRRLVAKTKAAPPAHAGKLKCETVAVVGGKGGVGKTTTTINLGFALSLLGNKVLVVDADPGLSGMEYFLDGPSGASFAEVAEGICEAKDTICPIEEGFDLLPGSSGIGDLKDIDELNVASLRAAFQKITQTYNYILIDTSTRIAALEAAILKGADRVLLVTNKDVTATVAAYGLLKALYGEKPQTNAQVIVNDVVGQSEAHRVYGKLNKAVRNFLDKGISFLGHISHDESMVRAVLERKPLLTLFPDCPASRDIQQLATSFSHPKDWEEGSGGLHIFTLWGRAF